MINNKGQITIFVIIGILIVAMILFFMFFRGGISLNLGGGKPEENPTAYLKSCIEPSIKDATKTLASQGGNIKNNLSIQFKFNDEKSATNLNYLCYNLNYYLPCINQEPMLIKHLKEQIESNTSIVVKQCVDDLKNSLEKRGYDVELNYRKFGVTLLPKKIDVDIDAKMSYSKSGETSSINGFKFSTPTRFYDLAIVVQEITSQEARFCNFEQQGFALFYPEFEIDKFRTGKGDIIYSVTDKKTNEKFRFAVRGCVIPPGF